ncbi:MAG: JAB domain-containing protein [Bacillota bacterium]
MSQLVFDLGVTPTASPGGKRKRAKEKYKSIPVVKIIMMKERQVLYENPVTSCDVAAEVAQKFLEGADRENFIILCLDIKNNITAINTVSIGCLNASMVHPREVYKPAILSNSAGIILAHNHPTGKTDPSKEDIEVTKRLVDAGRILGIDVLDHIIVGDGSSYSFKKQGLI